MLIFYAILLLFSQVDYLASLTMNKGDTSDTSQALIQTLRKNHGINLDDLVVDIQKYLANFNEEKFREAFIFAAKAHDGQLRKENKPYIIHPFEVARILASIHADENMLIAGLLHDVPEDTCHTIEEIEHTFGKKIAFLVNGITKLSKVHYQNDMQKRQIESLKKLFVYTAEDPRIILIKLADRLHNMRTLQFIDKPEKRARIARETLEIFVPVANLLGIEELKREMEDLCFRYLHENDYEAISERVNGNRVRVKPLSDETINKVQHELNLANIKGVVYRRERSIYGYYKWMNKHNKSIEDLTDFIDLMILVPERDDCYKALGIIHKMFKPKLEKFRDYIAVPKTNGYQSLHTRVFGLRGIMTQFQIRTHQMHLEAQYGVIATQFEASGPSMNDTLKKANWLERIQHIEQEAQESHGFLEDLKHDVLQDRIVIFTPKGDPVDLPKEATCIDFAYSIHTNVGHHAVKAIVNGEIVSLNTVLKTGDTVMIETDEMAAGPNREWLFFVKTNLAKRRIKEFFNRESQEAKISIGREILQKDFDRAGIGSINNISQKKVRAFLVLHPETNFKKLDDILAAIGDGSSNTYEFIKFIAPKTDIEDGQLSFFSKLLYRFNKVNYTGFTKVGVNVYFDSDKAGQLESLIEVIYKLGCIILKIKTFRSIKNGNFGASFTLLVKNFSQLTALFKNFEQIDGVLKVERQFSKRRIWFSVYGTITFILWALHPYVMYFFSTRVNTKWEIITTVFQLLSLFMLIGMAFSINRLTKKNFPELRDARNLWAMMWMLYVFALMTFFAEYYFFQLELHWYFWIGLGVLVLVYGVFEFISRIE